MNEIGSACSPSNQARLVPANALSEIHGSLVLKSMSFVDCLPMNKRSSIRSRSWQFSLRTLLICVCFTAVFSLFVAKYKERRVDFVDPPPAQTLSTPLTSNEFHKRTTNIVQGRAAYISRLQIEYPSRGIEYWQQQAAKVESGMTTYALFKYLPRASVSGSWLLPDSEDGPTQVFYYAVDSCYAALCEMTTQSGVTGRSDRVVRMVGIFPHHLQLNDSGTLNLTKLEIGTNQLQSRPVEPVVVFGPNKGDSQ